MLVLQREWPTRQMTIQSLPHAARGLRVALGSRHCDLIRARSPGRPCAPPGVQLHAHEAVFWDLRLLPMSRSPTQANARAAASGTAASCAAATEPPIVTPAAALTEPMQLLPRPALAGMRGQILS